MLLAAQDITEAFAQGRTWESFARKSGGVSSGAAIYLGDWCHGTGIPNFDARISGEPQSLYPVMSGGKEQLYHGPNMAPYRRYLHGVESAGFQSLNVAASFMVYDLLAYYPFIDGDGGLQILDNTLSLPRYADGAGVQMALLNTVIPQTTGSSNVVIEFVNQDGATVSTPVFSITNSYSNVYHQQGINNFASVTSMVPFVMLPSGSTGVRSVNSINIPTPTGGAYALCLIKPLMSFKGVAWGSLQNQYPRAWAQANRAMQFPEVLDGAALNILYMNGPATQAGGPASAMYKFSFFYA
jgi:hypothetical protein